MYVVDNNVYTYCKITVDKYNGILNTNVKQCHALMLWQRHYQ